MLDKLPPLGGNMTKTKLLGGMLVITAILCGSSVAQASNEQVYAKSAPTATEAFIKPVVKKAVVKPKQCKNWLVKELHKVGFRGKDLREAWAIVMRESGGKADAISSTGDYGMFQFNYAAWHKQDWWNTDKLLTRSYNAKVAYKISQGGHTWYPWDIDGTGRHKGNYTSSSVYGKFVSWYKKYPCK
jgi:hypothetical protein